MDENHILNDIAHCSSKRRLILHHNSVTDYDRNSIGAIFVLNSPNNSKNVCKVEIDKITGAEVIIELTKHSFILDVTDMNKIDEKFFNIGEVATSMIPIYRLTYSRDHLLLNSVRDTIKKMVVGY